MMTDTATAIREKPILFSAPMVLAILDGRKTQTRRIVKPQPLGEHDKCFGWFGENVVPPQAACAAKGLYCESSRGLFLVADCPYEVGMRLWVKETLQRFNRNPPTAQYAATITGVTGNEDVPTGIHGVAHWQWTRKVLPSVYMPRWASRITLEISEVRVERVQDISEADAISEGYAGENCYRNPRFVNLVTDDGKLPQEQFRESWERTYPGSWSRDWVWAITFRRLEQHA